MIRSTSSPDPRPTARPTHHHTARPATGGSAPLAGDSFSFGSRDANYGSSDGSPADGSVRQLQTDLQSLGYFKSSYGATGGYYAATRDAVSRFQAENSLPATGRADAATRAAIAASAGHPVAARAVQGPPVPTPVRPAVAVGNGLTTAQLAALGRNDPNAFFAALRPAAEECERRYGVPTAVTLGQAALESGFASHTPGGVSNNIFGHKGVGPAGSVHVASWEHGHSYKKVSGFKCYHNVSEGIVDHGATFHNGYYPRTVALIDGGNRDPRTFLKSIEGVYHQDGRAYTDAVMNIIGRYNLS